MLKFCIFGLLLLFISSASAIKCYIYSSRTSTDTPDDSHITSQECTGTNKVCFRYHGVATANNIEAPDLQAGCGQAGAVCTQFNTNINNYKPGAGCIECNTDLCNGASSMSVGLFVAVTAVVVGMNANF